MRPSISRRLVLWLAVPLMLLALCGALIHYFNNVAPVVISSDKRLKEATKSLAAHVQVIDARVFLVPAGAPPLPAADAVMYAVRDGQGRLLGGDERLLMLAIIGENSQLSAMTQVGHLNVRSLITRLDTTAGPVFIAVADLQQAAEPAARYGLMSTLLWDFVQLDITLVLVWVGIQFGLRPMKRLRAEIAARSPQDLRAIDEASVPRELAPLVLTLNRLFATLRSSVQAQQQFIANTAHQLRTPITGLQAQLELLSAESAAADAVAVSTEVPNTSVPNTSAASTSAASTSVPNTSVPNTSVPNTSVPNTAAANDRFKLRLATVQEGVRQLAHSANQLLALARADPAANAAGKNQKVQLDVIVAEVAAKFLDRALQSDIDLGVEVEPASIQADPALIDDLLSNLVDNALKYTPAAGRVTVRLACRQGRALLEVEDTGAGIPPAERQRVRQRFYRIANSSGHGSGLGLAIVDEIAQLYGASLVIDSGEGGRGTRVSIAF